MRVCFLNLDLREDTGAGRFGRGLIACLRAADSAIEPVVLTTVGSGHPWEEAILFPNTMRLLAALPRIRRVFRECDVIHALDGWPYGVIAAIAGIGLGKKLVITAIGTGAIQPLSPGLRPAALARRMLLAWAYRRASRVVAISNYTRREILARIPELSVSVINHAVRADEFVEPEALAPEETAAIERLKPYVLSVGGWKSRKGFEYSFPAFAEIAQKFPDLRYAVVGIGPKPWLEARHGITGRVAYFKGIRWPFLKALYRSAELFMLLPYNDRGDTEGFGFAFLEAAAAGIPVIGTRESGAEDAVRDGINGYLVPPRDAHAAAVAAVSILSHPGEKAKLSRASREFARSMSWDRVARSYREIYRALCPEASRRV